MEENSIFIAGKSAGIDQGLSLGIVHGEREALLELGREKFGPPQESVLSTLNAITSEETLKQIGKRIFKANSWKELLNH